MIRKSILVTALLLLATVQMLAASCDLRCSLMVGMVGMPGMAGSVENHDVGSHGQMARGNDHGMHCHGMPMYADNRCNSVLSGSGCGAAVCRARLDAIGKKSSPDELTSKAVAATVLTTLILSADQNTWTTSSARRSPDRPDALAPLDLRSGSSLRI
jgi:hypothetical protein